MVWGRITSLFILVLFAVPMSLACTTPVGDDTIINESTTICPGTYYINDGNTNGLFTLSDNVVLDCNGSTFIGNTLNYGIYLNNRLNVTIANCNMQNYSRLIYIKGSSTGNTIANNSLVGGSVGIYLDFGGLENTIDNNSIIGNTRGIYTFAESSTISNNHISGIGYSEEPQATCNGDIGISSYSTQTIVNNVVQNYSIGLCPTWGVNMNMSNNNISYTYYGVLLDSLENSVVVGNALRNNIQDVFFATNGLDSCPTIENNTGTLGDIFYLNATGTISGKNGTIILCHSNDSNITNNNGNIIVSRSSNVQIERNIVRNGNHGLFVELSNNMLVINNTIEYNNYGIYESKFASLNLTISDNTLRNNSRAGIDLVKGINSSITRNNITSSIYGIATSIESETSSGGSYSTNSINISIENNTISNCTKGMYIFNIVTNIQIINNDIRNSTRTGMDLGATTSGWRILNNRVSTAASYGIYVGLSNGILSNNTISNSSYGLYMLNSNQANVTENHAINNTVGLFMYNPTASIYSNNTFFGNSQDVLFTPSSRAYCANTIQNNTVTNGELTYANTTASISGKNGTIILCGANDSTISNSNANIIVSFSNNVTIFNVSACNQMYGIYLAGNNSIVSSSIITNNSLYGIYTTDNVARIYNNFFNNTNNTYADNRYIHTWNTTLSNGTNIIGGPLIGGNYWATPAGNGCSQRRYDSNNDSISDTGACILAEANNTDAAPLTITPSQHAMTSVLAPDNNSLLRQNVSINITFADIAHIFISIDSASDATYLLANTTNSQSTYNILWKTANGSFTDGQYNITITVRDANDAANNATFTVANLTIDNTPPSWNQTITDITTIDALLTVVGTDNTTYNISINDIPVVSNSTINLTTTLTSLTPQTSYIIKTTGCDQLNNCNTTNTTFTTNAEPTRTQQQESSHGGGSGGSAEPLLATPQEIIAPVTTKLTTYSTYNFKHGGEKHKISVQTITTNTVTLLIQSTPQLITLTNNTPKDIDLNNDTIADITITATITRNTATLNITPINKTQTPNTKEAPQQTTPQQKTVSTPEPKTVAQETTTNNIPTKSAQEPTINADAKTAPTNNTPIWISVAIIITIITLTLVRKRKKQ